MELISLQGNPGRKHAAEHLKLGPRITFGLEDNSICTALRIHVLEWSSRSPDLMPIENPSKGLETDDQRSYLLNLTGLELFCKEGWKTCQSVDMEKWERHTNRPVARAAAKRVFLKSTEKDLEARLEAARRFGVRNPASSL